MREQHARARIKFESWWSKKVNPEESLQPNKGETYSFPFIHCRLTTARTSRAIIKIKLPRWCRPHIARTRTFHIIIFSRKNYVSARICAEQRRLFAASRSLLCAIASTISAPKREIIWKLFSLWWLRAADTQCWIIATICISERRRRHEQSIHQRGKARLDISADTHIICSASAFVASRLIPFALRKICAPMLLRFDAFC